MRFAWLYVRSRSAPSAVLMVVLLCGTGAWAGRWLTTRPFLDPSTARVPVTVALATAVAVVLASTLHSPADEVERTTPRPWAGWRSGHALASTAAGLLLVAPVLSSAAYGQSSLVRNTAGVFGLALLAAVTLGPRLAWVLPLGYTACVYLSARLGNGDGRAVWAFIMQPASSTTAAISAVFLLAAGTAAWAAAARRAMR